MRQGIYIFGNNGGPPSELVTRIRVWDLLVFLSRRGVQILLVLVNAISSNGSEKVKSMTLQRKRKKNPFFFLCYESWLVYIA